MELEMLQEFNGFQDKLTVFELSRGKDTGCTERDKKNISGKFKVPNKSLLLKYIYICILRQVFCHVNSNTFHRFFPSTQPFLSLKYFLITPAICLVEYPFLRQRPGLRLPIENLDLRQTQNNSLILSILIAIRFMATLNC